MILACHNLDKSFGDRVIVEVASTNHVRGHINLRLVHRMRALH